MPSIAAFQRFLRTFKEIVIITINIITLFLAIGIMRITARELRYRADAAPSLIKLVNTIAIRMTMTNNTSCHFLFVHKLATGERHLDRWFNNNGLLISILILRFVFS